jgi:hypothetical protein
MRRRAFRAGDRVLVGPDPGSALRGRVPEFAAEVIGRSPPSLETMGGGDPWYDVRFEGWLGVMRASFPAPALTLAPVRPPAGPAT